MTARQIVDDAETAIRHLQKIIAGYPELDRRARITSRPDGYPRTASGATSDIHPRFGPSVHTFTLDERGLWWAWACSCDADDHTPQTSSLAALTAAQRHWEDSHGATTYADPTGDSGTTGHKPDEVAQRAIRLRRAITRILRDSEIAAAQLNEPVNTDDNETWCTNCARVKHPDGRPHLEPVYSKAKAKTDVGGRLAEATYLCRFDYDYVLAQPAFPPKTARLPTLEFTKERLRMGRAPRRIA